MLQRCGVRCLTGIVTTKKLSRIGIEGKVRYCELSEVKDAAESPPKLKKSLGLAQCDASAQAYGRSSSSSYPQGWHQPREGSSFGRKNQSFGTQSYLTMCHPMISATQLTGPWKWPQAPRKHAIPRPPVAQAASIIALRQFALRTTYDSVRYRPLIKPSTAICCCWLH